MVNSTNNIGKLRMKWLLARVEITSGYFLIRSDIVLKRLSHERWDYRVLENILILFLIFLSKFMGMSMWKMHV